MASQSSHQGKRLRHLNWPHSLTVCTAGREIPPVPLHTFPALAAAHPLQGSSGTTSATEQPPPAFGSASTRPAPGRRQQLGHLQDRKKDQPLAGEEQVLSTAVGCRVLQKKLRSQTRAMSVKRGGVMGRRLPWLCHRLQLTPGLAAKADGISPAAQPATPLSGHRLGFSLQAHLHPQRGAATVRTGTSRSGRSW